MLQETPILNAKGYVKLELYNEEGVFYQKEKKNLVVQSANEIVANMMADPAKVLRVAQVDKGDSALSANSEGLFSFALSINHVAKQKLENNWGELNEVKVFELEELKNLVSLDSVLVGETPLVVDTDIFVLDAAKGKIEFAVAPKENVGIRFTQVKNPYMKMIAGTELVKVNGVEWKRAAKANNTSKTYQVNALTGEILFEVATKLVEVSYDYHMNYALGFMALGGKPTSSHPNYQPVEFGNTNKLDTFMKNELPNSRMPIVYPASVSSGATELEPAIPTQPIAIVKKEASLTILDTGDDVTKVLSYDLANKHDTSTGLIGRMLHSIEKVTNVTKSTVITEHVSVSTNSTSQVKIAIADEAVDLADEIKIEYILKLDNRHLIYQLGQAPVVKLVSVRHIDAVDQTNIKEYTLVDAGLRPNQGDVWISNPNTGHITFSQEPTGGPKVETPGQIQVEYMVNAGTIVKFVADFPKGVPAPSIESKTEVKTVVQGQSTLTLDYAIAKEATGAFKEPAITVVSSGHSKELSSGEYSISLDGKIITPTTLAKDDVVTVVYEYEKTTHDIYQVAMFDDKTGGKMFNISGIGPVTKDKNTGMRVTWSVTF